MPQSFNDRFLGNASVPGSGEDTSAGPPAIGGSATGYPAIEQADGTGSPRVMQETKQAAPITSPTGGSEPPQPQHFNGNAV